MKCDKIITSMKNKAGIKAELGFVNALLFAVDPKIGKLEQHSWYDENNFDIQPVEMAIIFCCGPLAPPTSSVSQDAKGEFGLELGTCLISILIRKSTG
jgi:hypothetical protein